MFRRFIVIWFLSLMLMSPYASAWTGLSAGKLLAISEQGDRGFDISMLYIMGLADGVESQMVIFKGKECRQSEDISNQEIARKVITRMRDLDAVDEPAGKVALNAYLSEFCQEAMITADIDM
ncbi:hypothetical protein [Photobacterium sp. TY1-4]|uniref:hypothetical protein n=1 Tax=Photobacterium sp. TY1-4 TaxID=2899122 RepID=UPI0021C229F7|nr:hypothetical protein [Photobacterium sp. TY1-4]UXI04725.1 hypothetical protein NH461_25575 [Photobacterium sp. TY1-4]